MTAWLSDLTIKKMDYYSPIDPTAPEDLIELVRKEKDARKPRFLSPEEIYLNAGRNFLNSPSRN